MAIAFPTHSGTTRMMTVAAGMTISGKRTTGLDGRRFTFEWDAEQNDPFNNVPKRYAVFDGTSQFEGVRVSR